jgi:DNA sulfur modification protein DndD
MPNGTGKTTTLAMIRMTLAGSGSTVSSTEVKELAAPDNRGDTGEFLVHLRVDGAPITFMTLLDFEEGMAIHRTSSPKLGGVRDGWHPSTDLQPFLSPGFVSLYVFDGELAVQLMKKDGKYADQAINTLSQLYLFNLMQDGLDTYWEHRAITSKGGSRATKVTTMHKKMKSAVEYKNRLIEDKKEHEKELEAKQSYLKSTEKQIEEAYESNRKLAEERNNLLAKESQQQDAIQQTLSTIMTEMRDPLALGDYAVNALLDLQSNFERLKLPQTATSQFFRELSEAESCICGRPMTEEAKRTVLDMAEAYMAPDEQGVVNAIKASLANLSETPEERYRRQKSNFESLSTQKSDLTITRNNLKRLSKQLLEGGLDTSIEEKESRAEDLKEQIVKIQHEIAQYDRQDPYNTWNHTRSLSKVNQEIKRLEDEIARVTQTEALRERVQIVRGILTRAEDLSREKIKDQVLITANDRLASVLRDSPLRIHSIENSIKLENQTGASVGQTLSIGYVFLLSLLEHGANSFPLVVDSPAGPLDIPRRHEIGALIPRIADQFVAFVISPEREGFVPALEKASDAQIDYLTAYRKSMSQEVPKLSSLDVAISSNNGTVVRGRDFFMAFHAEED